MSCQIFCISASHDLLSYNHILDTGCLVLVRWNVTVYISTSSAAKCVVVLRLAVNIINDCC